jgi:hypothetical protein
MYWANCIAIVGNAQNVNQYIRLKAQRADLPASRKTSKIDLADAKYDEHHNYEFSCQSIGLTCQF